MTGDLPTDHKHMGRLRVVAGTTRGPGVGVEVPIVPPFLGPRPPSPYSPLGRSEGREEGEVWRVGSREV